VRKRYLLSAAVGVLGLVFAAVAIASPQFTQTADLKYTKNKGKVVAGVVADIHSSDPGANPPGNLPGATKVVIKFKGSKVNTKAGKRCTKSKSQAATCPKSTKVGSGSAKANIVGTNPTTGQTAVSQDVFGGFKIAAYLTKGGFYFVITSKTPGGPVTVLKATITKKGTLTANVARDTAGTLPPPNKIVLTSFKLKLKKVAKGRGKRRKMLFRTPKCGKSRKFTITSKFNYDDGTTKTVTSKQTCRK
jgi:hypothetical protein